MKMKEVPSHYKVSMNYFYLYMWVNILLSTLTRNPSRRLLHKYEPSVPVVYIYGKKKPFMFHGAK